MEAHENFWSRFCAKSRGMLTWLDLPEARGHHAIWLAQQGWRMTLADWAEGRWNGARDRMEDPREPGDAARFGA